MGVNRIVVSVPRHKVVTSTKTIVGSIDGPWFGNQMTRVVIHPIPEVQALIDDGTIVDHLINGPWRIGTLPVAQFFFEDPDAAMLFKLMWA